MDEQPVALTVFDAVEVAALLLAAVAHYQKHHVHSKSSTLRQMEAAHGADLVDLAVQAHGGWDREVLEQQAAGCAPSSPAALWNRNVLAAVLG